MPIDSRIPLGFQMPEFEKPLDLAQKGQSMKNLAMQGQLQQQQIQQNEMIAHDKIEAKHKDRAADLLIAATPDNWTQVVKQMREEGLPNAEHLPDFYDPKIYNQVYAAAVGHKALQEQKNIEENREMQERQIAESRAERRNNAWLAHQDRQDALGLREKELDAKRNTGANLPLDQKNMVDTLSNQNAKKTSIKNQIDSVVAGWDKLSDDQKVSAGNQLLKTLNSTEGADAIGADEAKRLGAKLQFAMGNFTNSNPTQFGRDLDGFKEQAQNVSKAINGAIGTNQKEIDKIMGRKPADQPQGDFVLIIPPGGTAPKKVPRAHAKAAIAAGGKVVTSTAGN